jgi:hypothetical protein
LYERDVLVYENPQTHQLTTTIIDYDLSTFLNQQECAQISRQPIPLPDQLDYASAHADNERIAGIIGIIIEERKDVLAITGDGLAYAEKTLDYLLKLKEEQLAPDQRAIAIRIIHLILNIRRVLAAKTNISQTTVAL